MSSSFVVALFRHIQRGMGCLKREWVLPAHILKTNPMVTDSRRKLVENMCRCKIGSSRKGREGPDGGVSKSLVANELRESLSLLFCSPGLRAGCPSPFRLGDSHGVSSWCRKGRSMQSRSWTLHVSPHHGPRSTAVVRKRRWTSHNNLRAS